MWGWRLLACAAVAVATPALPAGAVSQKGAPTPINPLEPASVTILQGESVTWNNTGGNLHNVHFDDGSYDMPADPDSSTWSKTRTFLTAGTFKYYCDAHGGPDGVGMSGTVTVLTPGSNPPPPPPPVTDKS